MAKIKTRKAKQREVWPDWYVFPATYEEARPMIDPKLFQPRRERDRGRFIRRPTWRQT
jgi:hypothetical protein